MGGTYLYGIIEGAGQADLGITGVDGHSPVRVLGANGLGCAVSEYPAGDLRSLSKEKLVRHLLRHQQVVEHVMQRRTVLPVKFGTTLEGPEEVRALLTQAHRDLEQALAQVRDKVEIEVAATWDTQQVLKELSIEKEIVRAREAFAEKRRGKACLAPTLEDQWKLGQLVKACMDKRRESYRERMVSFLKPFAVDVAPNILVSDEMVMNVAFLVEERRQAESDEALQRLDRLFQRQINFRVIGPLPPYSFSTVVIARITPEQVKEAQHTLGLTELISDAEVRQAYRRQAAQEQRNLRQRDGTGAARFNQLRRAAEVLLSYVRASQQSPSISPLQGGNEGGVFRVTIKRSEAEDLPHAPFARFEGD